jgi:signal peptidase I
LRTSKQPIELARLFGGATEIGEIVHDRLDVLKQGRLPKVIGSLILTVALLLAAETFVAQPYRVEQGDMRSTLLANQIVLLDKLTSHFTANRRGDIVVFTPPGATTGWFDFVKRVIGLPGETVDLQDGHVMINGQELSEPYVFEGQPTEPFEGNHHWVVPAGALFVLGDHRQVSVDSRSFGPIPATSVVGRAWLRFWPLDVIGSL